MLPGHDDVNLRPARPEDVSGLLHGHTSQAGPVDIDDLVAN